MAVSTYTPDPFPLSGDLQLISPYWGDVDTRGTGSVWYRESINRVLLARAQNEIRAAFPVIARTFSPFFLFIATWDHVGYYSSHTDKVRTQSVINYVIIDILLVPYQWYLPWSDCFHTFFFADKYISVYHGNRRLSIIRHLPLR